MLIRECLNGRRSALTPDCEFLRVLMLMQKQDAYSACEGPVTVVVLLCIHPNQGGPSQDGEALLLPGF